MKSATLVLKLSEKRQRIAELVGLEEPDAEQLGEMETIGKELPNLEIQYRAALMAETEEARAKLETGNTPEGRELRGLLDRANVGELFDSVLEHRQIDGAFREVQEHYGLAGNQLPLAMLEERAVTPAPGQRGTGSATDHSLRVPGKRGLVSRNPATDRSGW